MLLTGVIERVEDQDSVREILRGKRVDRRDSLPFRLRQFVGTLIEHRSLDRQTEERLFYGRAELNMLLLTLDERARRTPLNYIATLQLRLQLLFFFYTGVRPSSLAQYKTGSDFFRVKDVRVLQLSRFSYAIELKVRNIKKFNTALSMGMNQTWILRPITKSQSAFIDIGAVAVPFLIARGFLFDGKTGIQDISQLLASTSASLSCEGEDAYFLADEKGLGGLTGDKTQRYGDIANNIGSLCQEAGLPKAGGYTFRNDVGNFFYAAYGLEKLVWPLPMEWKLTSPYGESIMQSCTRA
ncbi:hypothetical protein OC835_007307 [Tilletia horrida]|nr:hypothetical protein OC835_007307 [Tilletia horrida]